MNRSLLALLFVLPLGGCDFFTTPPPDPSEDGLLSCDEDQPLDALTSADELDLDAGDGVGLRITTAFADVSDAAVLRIFGAGRSDHLGEFHDPVSDTTVLTGTIEVGQSARVELFSPGGGTLGGSLRLACSAPEICWNLADDDGDGRVDCADPLCARDPDCEDAQEPLETPTVSCSTTFTDIEPPVLRAIDDQQTLYRTSPFGAGVEPTIAFWGGAELVIDSLPPSATGATVRVGGSGLFCAGIVDGAAVSCDRVVELTDGDEVSFTAGEVAWFEPTEPSWASFAVQVDCTN